ncbi:trypsin-like serine protease [Streptomyces sp. NRRL S-37]|uniref:trypsin-like serine protease n=1 Tax=Streptomyces sp. NRRL S-37 TaxID=1463903 RepID=UPI0004C4D66C|nr:trypsin-like serine protease [Streptomyces sp. NRRL S-37]
MRDSRTGLWAAGSALTAAMALVGALASGASAGQQHDGNGEKAVPISQVVGADDLRKMNEQRPLVAAASILAKAQEQGDYEGYTGIGLQEEHVTLWWKGDLPEPVRQAAERARGTAPVRIVAAEHSLAELEDASEVLQARLEKDPSLGHSVKIPTDGSGLVLARDTTSTARTASAAQARRTVDRIAGVPVKAVSEEPLRERSRVNDGAPWSGGAQINFDGGACTAGFGVRDASATYLLTAEHCGRSGNRFTNPQGAYIGTSTKSSDPHDVMLIPTNSDNFMYTGGPDSDAGVRVDGWDHVFPGEYLCQSGITSARATGGPVCNIKVLFFYNDSEDLVEAEQMNGQTVARSGDSGGPVYTASASGGAIAKGTLTRSAGSRLGFQDFYTATRDFGIWINK